MTVFENKSNKTSNIKKFNYLQCVICGKEFEDQSQIKSHFQSKHQQIQKLTTFSQNLYDL